MWWFAENFVSENGILMKKYKAARTLAPFRKIFDT